MDASSREELQKQLIDKAKSQSNSLSFDDILGFFPDIEADISYLDDLMDMLLQAGMEVRSSRNNETLLDDEDLANSAEKASIIYFADISLEFLKLLSLYPEEIFALSPEQFELLICNRLEKMGYEIERVTENANSRDGGVDILAWLPKSFSSLIAVQAKHHPRATTKTSVKPVRELKGVVNENTVLQSGLLVTNTSFTKDAVWDAKRSRKLLSLRGFDDLEKWIRDDFSNENISRDMPEEIEIGRGIKIPSSRFQRLL